MGANLGDPAQALDRACIALEHSGALTDVRRSTFRWTAPVGPVQDQPRFLNGVVAARTTWTPRDILTMLHQLEQQEGRDRDGAVRWGPRPIDLDLLMVGDLVSNDGLHLPHKEMHRRRFVLEPLAELAPDLVHPVLGKTVSQLLEALP